MMVSALNMDVVYWLGGFLTALTIVRYMYRGAKSALLKAFNFAEAWKNLVDSVHELKELAAQILKMLQEGKDTMTEHAREIASIKSELSDAKGRIKVLEGTS